jgi:hypothetical protein
MSCLSTLEGGGFGPKLKVAHCASWVVSRPGTHPDAGTRSIIFLRIKL